MLDPLCVLMQMFRSSKNPLGVWATLLFASFIYILPIVLIGVLIAIVQDIYDRVRSKEKAELRRLRLRIVAKFQSTLRVGAFISCAIDSVPYGR